MKSQKMSEEIENDKYILELIANKSFSIKDTGLSYRVINNWSTRGLINHFRSASNKWHTFSFLELVEISIYKELRELGLSIENLKNVKKYLIDKYNVENKVIFFEEKEPFTSLLDAVLRVLIGENMYLVVDYKCFNACFLSELIFLETILEKNELSEEIYGLSPGLLFVSLRRLLEKMKIKVERDENKLSLVITSLLDDDMESQMVINSALKNGKPHINSVKKISYKSFKDIKDLKREINKPNQKTIINSNQFGANKITIEKQLK